MKPILIVYATREGHTRRIADYITVALGARGCDVRLCDLSEGSPNVSPAALGGVVLAASVHAGKHEREMVRFVRKWRDELAELPTTFLSVSLAEAGAEDATRTEEGRENARAEVDAMVEAFFDQTGFRPSLTKPVAGALLYTQYGRLLRFVMRIIVSKRGGSTDTSRDHVYTDWRALDVFADELLATFRSDDRRPPPSPTRPTVEP